MNDRAQYTRWIRAALADTGVSQAELGRRIGLTKLQVNHLVHGKRLWEPGLVEKIAVALRVARSGESHIHPSGRPQYAEVVGVVNPGVWYENDVNLRDLGEVLTIPDPRISDLTQVAYLLEIDVPGAGLKAGSHIIAVPIDEASHLIQSGSKLICERRRDGNLKSYMIGQASFDGDNLIVRTMDDALADDAQPIAVAVGTFRSLI